MSTVSDLSAAKSKEKRRLPAMSIKSPRRTGPCRFLVALLALAIWPSVAATQDNSAGTAPANAHMQRYGAGWDCDRGFRERTNSCAPLEIPQEGHAGRSGNDWECNRGYQQHDETCVAIEVPSNGYLDSPGRDWDCERGFKKSLYACLPFEVPTNAHLSHSGNSWACDPGYQRRGETCAGDKSSSRRAGPGRKISG